jgi:hypothetical protein
VTEYFSTMCWYLIYYIRVAWRVTYIRKTLLTFREHSSSPRFLVGSVLLIFFVCVAQLYVFTYWVLCCDVCYDFRIITMFVSSLPPVVCLNYVICVYFGLVLFWVFFRLVYPTCMLPVSLDCPFLIFPNVYLRKKNWKIRWHVSVKGILD